MIFNFGGEIDTYKITVKLGNTIVQESEIPSMFAQVQFMQLVQQVSQDEKPLQVKCSIKDYTESNKEIENCLIFSNNSYLNAFGED